MLRSANPTSCSVSVGAECTLSILMYWRRLNNGKVADVGKTASSPRSGLLEDSVIVCALGMTEEGAAGEGWSGTTSGSSMYIKGPGFPSTENLIPGRWSFILVKASAGCHRLANAQ